MIRPRTVAKVPVKTKAATLAALAKRRKERYINDPAYRLRVQEQARNQYRSKVNVELESCLPSLAFFELEGQERTVQPPQGKTFTAKTYSKSKTAKLLGVLFHTFHRWVMNGQVPAPVYQLVDGPDKVYTVGEVRVLIEEIGKHTQTTAYYRRCHRDVQQRIVQRIGMVRTKLQQAKR